MSPTTRIPRRREHGQIMVLFVLSILVVIAGAAVILDGGNLWAQTRVTQNGSDSSAEAGAVVLAQRLSGAVEPGGGWDAAVEAAINNNATANGIVVDKAYYTDICGIPLTPGGAKAVNGSNVETLNVAAQVGSGFPTSSATTPDCPSLTVGPPAGVLVVGRKDVNTFFAGVIGMNQVPVNTRATAVSGYIQGFCDATEDEACAILPVTIPVNVATCDGSGDLTTTGNPWLLGPVYRIPLCKNGPGNVGWLDWTPPSGGSSELVCSILHPNNPAIDLPSWQYVTATGNTNGGGGACGMSVEAAIRTYNGQVVMIPQFDMTCGPDPDQSQVAIGPNYGCSAPNSGHGQRNWYRMPSFAFLKLCSTSDAACLAEGLDQGAYIGGSNKTECEVGGNGATGCLVGRFVKILATGTVGAGVGGGIGGEKVVGVQLIK
jgi:hypothetical protein